MATAQEQEPLLLSATIICKNEVDKIRGALESVRFCDEVVVVDSGSTDGTVAICRELADVVVETDWPGHIAQKNRAVDLARGRWVLALDADERVTPELASEVRRVVSGDPAVHGYAINRHVYYLGRWIHHSGWYPEPRVRLFRRDKGRWGGVNPHDEVRVDGSVGALRGEILHYSYDDISDHVRTLNRFSSILAVEHSVRGRRFRWFSLLVRPPVEFLKKFVIKRGFLDGAQGFFVASLSAFYVFLKVAKLWELERASPSKRRGDSGP